MNPEFERRVEKLKNILNYGEVALISPGTNFYYLTGLSPLATLERLFLLVISPDREPIILAPKLYQNDLKNNTLEKIFWKDGENPYAILKNIIDNPKRVFVEDTLPSGMLLNIMESLKDVQFSPLNPLMAQFRIRKSEEELTLLKKAGKIVDDVFYYIVENVDPRGKKESEIVDLIVSLIKEFGGEDISFPPIVASGPNGANPHHNPGERKIRNGDLVIMDYGAKYGGYCSDITRTIAVGKISEEAKKVYNIVKEAQETAFRKVAVGVKAMDIDLAARNVISTYGYGEYFTHRTGHGLGLDVHEPPFITSVNDEILENGMVFTIEPGIYLPGKFGVRIEDDIAIIDGKGVRLTQADRELREI